MSREQQAEYGGAHCSGNDLPFSFICFRDDAPQQRLNRESESDEKRDLSIKSGDLELDLAAHSASKAGKSLHLTSAEFDLLHAFLESPGQVLSREALVERVLGRKFSPFDRSLDLHVSNLRQKLGPQANRTERIRSVRGVGYLYAWPL